MLGKDCVDDRDSTGVAGFDVAAFVLMKTHKHHLWPIEDHIASLKEDDIFDLIELLFDQVSTGTEGEYHSFNNCGMHYTKFDRGAGQAAWRAAINEYLPDYGEGFELSDNGEVLRLGATEFQNLLAAPLPTSDPHNVENRIQVAVHKFRQRASGPGERRDAVRDLADVLEYLRPKLKQVINSKDEADLFNLLNNFGVRHHNQQQKTGYDEEIWLNWMFYFYLATIHAALRLMKRREKRKHSDRTIGASGDAPLESRS
jgi:hypothetical protein